MTRWKVQRGEARYIIYEEEANGHCKTVLEIPTVKLGRKLKMNEAAINQIVRDHNRAASTDSATAKYRELIARELCLDSGKSTYSYAITEIIAALDRADLAMPVCTNRAEELEKQVADLKGALVALLAERKEQKEHAEAFEAMREALKHNRDYFLRTYEKEAEAKAMDGNFGVSEWEAFMPKEYHDTQAALALAERAAQASK